MGGARAAAQLSGGRPRFETKGLTGKASLNAVAAGLDYGARVLVELAINPFMVASLGDYLYGLWRILWRVSNYVVLMTGRSAQALKTVIANQQSSDDFGKKRRDLGASLVVWLLTQPLVIAFSAVLVWYMPVLLKVPGEFVSLSRVAAAMLAANVIVLAVADVPRAVLQGENLGYKRMGLSSVLVFAGGGLMVLALRLGLGLVGVAGAALATTLLNGALFLGVVKRHVPWFGLAMPSRADVRGFMKLSGWFTLWRLVLQLMSASDVVILGMLDSVGIVTVYTLTKYVPEAMIGLVATFVFGAVPGLGGVIGSGKLEKAARVRTEIQSFTWFVATVAGTMVLLWNRSFLGLWVGAKYDAGPLATLLITTMTTQFVLIRNDANLIDLTLRVQEKTLVGLLSSVLSVLLACLFVGPLKLGIAGLCLGYISGRSLMSVLYPWRMGRLLGQSFASQVQGAIRPVLATAALYGLGVTLGPRLAARSWPALVLQAGLTAATLSLLAPLVGLSTEQRRLLLRRFRRMAEQALGAPAGKDESE